MIKHDTATKSDYAALAETLFGYPIPFGNSILRLNDVIAVGAFGVVFLGSEYSQGKLTRKRYAVKCLLRNHSNPYADKFVWQETTNHSAVQHPNVVTVLQITEHVDVVFLIMEHCPNGDLFKAIIDRHEFVGQDDKVRIAWLQIAEGVRACHSRGIYHRDIKPENILIRSVARPSLHLVLADFGLSTKEEWSFEFGVGSSYYMSPECFKKQRRGHKKQPSYSSRLADIWALGVVLINLCCGRNPWLRAHPDEPTYASFCEDTDYLGYILPITAALNDLLKRVFRTDPSRRIALDEFIDAVRRMHRFTLNYEELEQASDAIRAAAGPLLQIRWEQDMTGSFQSLHEEGEEIEPEGVALYRSPQGDRRALGWDPSDDDSIYLVEASDTSQDTGTFGTPVVSQVLEAEDDNEENEELDGEEHDEENNQEAPEAERVTSHSMYDDEDVIDLAEDTVPFDDGVSDAGSAASTEVSWIASSPPLKSDVTQWDVKSLPHYSYIYREEPYQRPNTPVLRTPPSVPSTPNCGIVTPAETDLYDDCKTFPDIETISFANSSLRSGLHCRETVSEGPVGTQPEYVHSIPHKFYPAKRPPYAFQCDADVQRYGIRPTRGTLERFGVDTGCWRNQFPL